MRLLHEALCWQPAKMLLAGLAKREAAPRREGPGGPADRGPRTQQRWQTQEPDRPLGHLRRVDGVEDLVD
eukprot:3337654-Lingulodinium_polyedra.AAC.1